jgi:hypothetical protein
MLPLKRPISKDNIEFSIRDLEDGFKDAIEQGYVLVESLRPVLNLVISYDQMLVVK